MSKSSIIKIKPVNSNSNSKSNFHDKNNENFYAESEIVIRNKKVNQAKGVRFSDEVTIMNSHIENNNSKNNNHHHHNHHQIFRIPHLLKEGTYTIFKT